MSMHYVVLAPVDPWHVPTEEQQNAAIAYLRTLDLELPLDDDVLEVKTHEGPQVNIGPESYYKAQCPNCMKVFDSEWMLDSIFQFWNEERKYFDGLVMVMPCCGISINVNSLHFPLGEDFAKPLAERNPMRSATLARFWISIRDVSPLEHAEMRQLEEKLGTPLLQVFAIY